MEVAEETREEARRRVVMGSKTRGSRRGRNAAGKHPLRASAENAEKKATATGSGAGKQRPSGGLLRGVEKIAWQPSERVPARDARQVQAFLAVPRGVVRAGTDGAGDGGGALGDPDAAPFADEQVAAFLDMMQRENKIMLHEGTVMII